MWQSGFERGIGGIDISISSTLCFIFFIFFFFGFAGLVGVHLPWSRVDMKFDIP